MNIDGTTLILIFLVPATKRQLSAGPQKQEYKVGHDFFYCLSLEKVRCLFSIIKIRVIFVSNKKKNLGGS